MNHQNRATDLWNFVDVLQIQDKSDAGKYKKGVKKCKLVTLYMSNQYVCFTGYITLKPDKIGLCTTTALKRGKREAKSKVGPLPTDWP